jgi:hypothetical protein
MLHPPPPHGDSTVKVTARNIIMVTFLFQWGVFITVCVAICREVAGRDESKLGTL